MGECIEIIANDISIKNAIIRGRYYEGNDNPIAYRITAANGYNMAFGKGEEINIVSGDIIIPFAKRETINKFYAVEGETENVNNI